MDIVTDTSAILAIALNEPDKQAIIQQTQGAILYAPPSFHWEIRNALSSLLKRGKIDIVQAKDYFTPRHQSVFPLSRCAHDNLHTN